MTNPLLISFILSLALLFTGCAAQPQKVTTQAPKTLTTPQTETQKATEVKKGHFEPSTLYALLVAELAAQRQRPQITLHNYLQEAQRTRDPGILRRATQIAQHLKNSTKLIEAALLWSEVEPDNLTPLKIVSTELIRQKRFSEALPLLERLLSDDGEAPLQFALSHAEKFSEDDRDAYLDMVNQQLALQPNAAYLLYTKATLTQHGDGIDEALTLIRQSLDQDPEFIPAVMLEAELQNRAGHTDTALGHLREELQQTDHKQMRVLYTRLLLEKQLYRQAEQQVEHLLNAYTNDHNLQFYLSVLLLDHNQFDLSERYLSNLLDTLGDRSVIHYHLGRIAQAKDDREAALTHYLKVTEDPYLLSSYSEVSNLLNQNDNLERIKQIFDQGRQTHTRHDAMLYAIEASWLVDRDLQQLAMQLFNQALNQHPDDTRLRYSRAMLGERLGDMALLESDLRRILSLDPKNSTALNALGYTLTDHTDRHSEALALISKALKLKPDDPAILDSMGWVYFHLGEIDKAIHYLTQAYASFPDAEIATHLGKVYWSIGKINEALKIWREALDQQPDSQLLIDALTEAQKGI